MLRAEAATKIAQCSPRFLMTEKVSRHTGHCRPGDAGGLGITACELLEELVFLMLEEVVVLNVAVVVGESVRSMVTFSL